MITPMTKGVAFYLAGLAGLIVVACAPGEGTTQTPAGAVAEAVEASDAAVSGATRLAEAETAVEAISSDLAEVSADLAEDVAGDPAGVDQAPAEIAETAERLTGDDYNTSATLSEILEKVSPRKPSAVAEVATPLADGAPSTVVEEVEEIISEPIAARAPDVASKLTETAASAAAELSETTSKAASAVEGIVTATVVEALPDPDPLPSDGVLASGTWTKKTQRSRGTWSITREAGRLFVKLDGDFSTRNAPDLKLFLSPIPTADVRNNNAINGALFIAPLASNKGAQSYPLPEGVDLSTYKSVLIHCEAYTKLWSSGDL